MSPDYQPVFEVTRGGIVESMHYGAAVVVDSSGRVLSWYGDPQIVTFMRSSAKPLQALPFIEAGGDQYFHLTSRELAIICGSHDGSDKHVSVIQGIQSRVGVKEDDLLCGIQPPLDEIVADQLKIRGETPTSNRHNCSGKHTAMLAYASMLGQPIGNYVDFDHPIQQNILSAFAEMCDLPLSRVVVGRDGCSVPAFAVPLYNAALSYARLSDPHGLPSDRAAACRRITAAMLTNPEMVAGPKRFDTRLMQVGSKRIISKGGAEGFLAIGILPGAMGVDSPGIGIALKVSDGDQKNRVRPALALEILKQTNLLSDKELEALAEFGPILQVKNWRKFVVGESRPVCALQKAG
ncbi:MAG TPA: asparaginase [Anaerolineae bacterium]|nr:asparaginase [Anaerolineae bacterium]